MSSAGRAGRSRSVSRRPRRCSSTGVGFLAGLARRRRACGRRAARLAPTTPIPRPRSIRPSATRPIRSTATSRRKSTISPTTISTSSAPASTSTPSALKIRPWTVKLDGLVEKEQTVDIDALIKAMGLEERLYRHRCVEAWSMAIPWTGFPLKKLVDVRQAAVLGVHTSGSRRSSTRRWRRGSARSCRGPMSRA